MLRWLTAGESHGPALVAMMEGLPAGVEVGAKDLQTALSRRRELWRQKRGRTSTTRAMRVPTSIQGPKAMSSLRVPRRATMRTTP